MSKDLHTQLGNDNEYILSRLNDCVNEFWNRRRAQNTLALTSARERPNEDNRHIS